MSNPPLLLSTYSSTEADLYPGFEVSFFFCTKLESERGVQAREHTAELGAANTSPCGPLSTTKGKALSSGQACLSSKPRCRERRLAYLKLKENKHIYKYYKVIRIYLPQNKSPFTEMMISIQGRLNVLHKCTYTWISCIGRSSTHA